ncbi:hypothetical protein [Clostridium estertheticum]|uniref:hypothetical protein n=1 Tax=Clostridium estertheticum TaxID=238834 RepID=UPI001C7CA09A|nr:hypothetical protein [Clostridium estertheticum]MBX4265465.1 hypothetical protein [Clostridium estertheticum]WLC90184.1 hypothetical protein KTC95_08375 [Clostridium estertheticum]
MSNTTLFLLKNHIKCLEDVEQKILIISKKEVAKNIREIDLKTISEANKYFYSKWKSNLTYSNINVIKLPKNTEIRFLVKEAYIETSKRAKNMFDSNNKLLPKNDRTIYENVKTVFFELNNQVYIILFTISATALNKIKEKLLDNGQVLQQVGAEYDIDDDFFYWLFYIYSEKDKLIAKKFTIEAISGFEGNIADEHHIVKSVSELTPSLLVTKAFVSKFHPIRSVSMILKLDEYSLNFIINDSNQCSIGLSSVMPNNRYDIDISASIVIYGYMIPNLLSLYKNDENWSYDIKKEFAKKVGIEVICDIVKFHGINLKDVITILNQDKDKIKAI